MFLLVLCSVLISQRAFAYPPSVGGNWRVISLDDDVRSFGTPKNYFSNIDVEKFNPFNWIPNRRTSFRDEYEIKFRAVFDIFECIIKNEPKECSKLVNEAKSQFVRKAPPTPVTSTGSETNPPRIVSAGPNTIDTIRANIPSFDSIKAKIPSTVTNPIHSGFGAISNAIKAIGVGTSIPTETETTESPNSTPERTDATEKTFRDNV